MSQHPSLQWALHYISTQHLCVGKYDLQEQKKMVTCSVLYLFHHSIQVAWITFITQYQQPDLPVIQKACPRSAPRLAQHTFLILQEYPGLKVKSAFRSQEQLCPQHSLFHKFQDPAFSAILLDRAVEGVVVVSVRGLPRHSGLHRKDSSLQLSLEK